MADNSAIASGIETANAWTARRARSQQGAKVTDISAWRARAENEQTAEKTQDNKPRSSKDTVIASLQKQLKTLDKPSQPLPPAERVRNEQIIDEQNLISVDFGDRATREAAKDAAIKLLARKQLSVKELENELQKQEFNHTLCAEVAAECEAEMLIDELALARAIVENNRGRKGKSAQQIKQKLVQRRLSESAIAAALAEIDEAEEKQLICDTAFDRAQRLNDLDFATAERRLLAFLARRGWSGYETREIAREALRAAGID
ncbi:regulatory protein RecX [Canibacter zhoujuaniae]|nr:RecX family transcriptional regulator [Canibacter zhoujuaniae]